MVCSETKKTKKTKFSIRTVLGALWLADSLVGFFGAAQTRWSFFPGLFDVSMSIRGCLKTPRRRTIIAQRMTILALYQRGDVCILSKDIFFRLFSWCQESSQESRTLDTAIPPLVFN